MLFDGIMSMTFRIIEILSNLLPNLAWPSFLDLSGVDFDLSYFSHFVPIGLFADIIGFLILYTTAKWSVKLIEIITRRRILP